MTNGKFSKWQELLLEPPRVCESQFAMNSLNGSIANGNMNDGELMWKMWAMGKFEEFLNLSLFFLWFVVIFRISGIATYEVFKFSLNFPTKWSLKINFMHLKSNQITLKSPSPKFTPIRNMETNLPARENCYRTTESPDKTPHHWEAFNHNSAHDVTRLISLLKALGSLWKHWISPFQLNWSRFQFSTFYQ